jgi:uncharacterized protein YxjI
MFDCNKFLIKERVGFMKMRNAYDIHDLESGEKLGVAMENTPGWVCSLRLFLNKQLLPSSIYIATEENGRPLMTLSRGMTFFTHKITIKDEESKDVGLFKSKMFSIKSKFLIFDPNSQQMGEVTGDWKGWNFKVVNAKNEEIGVITKKWAGLGKELFTSADNYVVAINEEFKDSQSLKLLVLGAGVAIDHVYKENKK